MTGNTSANHSSAADEPKPVWEFAGLPHIDLISEEPTSVIAYIFRIAQLEEVAEIYSDPVFAGLLTALRDLIQSQDQELREQSFTIFAGDVLGYNNFVLAVETEDEKLVNFLSPYMRRVPGYYTLEAGSSSAFLPSMRYDKGYVIEYAERGLQGTSYVDDDEHLGSGLTIYCRTSMPPYAAGEIETAYGQLKSS